MLQGRSFTGNDDEHAAVDALVAEQDPDGELGASVTRTDPDEQGLLRVEIAGNCWLVTEDGTTTVEEQKP